MPPNLPFKFRRRETKVEPPTDQLETKQPSTLTPYQRHRAINKGIKQFADAEEKELWNAYATNKSIEIRNLLVLRYLADAEAIASQYRLPEYSLSDANDLRSAAYAGLVKAVDCFDPTRGVKFIVFARTGIYGSIIDELRRMMDFPRVISSNRRRLKKPIEALHHKLGREPTIDEICTVHGEHLRPIVSDPLFKSGVFNQYQVSGNSDEDGGDGEERIGAYEWVEDNRKESRRAYERGESRKFILDLLTDPEQRHVIFSYYYLRMNHAQIGPTLVDERHPFGKCISTSVNIYHKALATLKQKLGPDGRQVLRKLIGLE